MSFSENHIAIFMNASSNVSNVEIANKVASTATLFRKYFPDAIVNFRMLEKNNLLKIVDKFLMELESQLLEKEISISVSNKAKESLLNLGFDSINGARPMAKLIQDKILY